MGCGAILRQVGGIGLIPVVAAAVGLAGFAESSARADGDAGVTCSDAGVSSAGAWFWDSSFPFGNGSITGSLAVWAFAPNDAWVGGYTGLLVHWDGTSWTVFNPGTTEALYRVWGDAPNDVWALGAYDLLHYNGTTWTSTGSFHNTGFIGLWGTGPHDVWAVQQGDPLYHFTGVWTAVPSNASTAQDAVLESVWAPRPGEAWAAGYGLFHYEGLAWAPVNVPGITTQWGSVCGGTK